MKSFLILKGNRNFPDSTEGNIHGHRSDTLLKNNRIIKLLGKLCTPSACPAHWKIGSKKTFQCFCTFSVTLGPFLVYWKDIL